MENHSAKFQTLYQYFSDNPDLYQAKKNSTFRIIFAVIALLAIVLAINPELINFTGIGFRIVFGVIALFAISKVIWNGSVDFYNKKSGEKIKSLKFKKFSINGEDDMEEIIEAYENEDFEALRDVPSTDNGSLRIEIDYDKKGKECYMMLRNEYYGDINYVSEIKVFKDEKFDELYPILRKL